MALQHNQTKHTLSLVCYNFCFVNNPTIILRINIFWHNCFSMQRFSPNCTEVLLWPSLSHIPHGICRTHNFTGGGGHIDLTTFKALSGPDCAPWMKCWPIFIKGGSSMTIRKKHCDLILKIDWDNAIFIQRKEFVEKFQK